ncbi:programmed cell death protein 5-like isoform X1 [Branchiostoma floridae x Branchiostoma japonicum]
MADPELEEIRARRMAEMQQQMGQSGQNLPFQLPPGVDSGDGYPGAYQQGGGEQKAEQQARQEELKNTILAGILDQAARSRLNNLKLVKPEKAAMVENMLIQMAQSGQVQGKIGEDHLKTILERVSEQTKPVGKVKFQRRKVFDDDSDDDY